jgi:hypothetical protein
MPNPLPKRFIWITVGTAALGLAAAAWLGPLLIGQAYREESLPLLNRALAGRATHTLEFYVGLWYRLLLWVAVGFVVLLGAGAVAFRYRSALAESYRKLASGPRVSPWRTVLLAFLAGAVAGTLEVAHLGVRHLIEQDPRRAFIWELWWMAPSAGALAFTLVALLAAVGVTVLARVRGTEAHLSLRWVVAVLAFGAVYSMLESPRFRLAQWSVLVLCAGVAVAAARGAAGRPSTFRALVRRATPVVVAGMAIATGVGLWTLPGPLERRRLDRLPDAGEGLPNVLLIILDTVRAESLSLYGYARPTTPKLEQWASRGVVFENAISSSSWTLPSHASLFTGRFHHEVSADRLTPLDDTYPTLAEILSEHGYATAAFAANFTYVSEGTGLARGFARFEDFPVTWGRFFISSWLCREIAGRLLSLNQRPWRTGPKTAEHNTDDFLTWSEERGGDRPFFAFLNYLDAHAPYVSPQRFRERFPSDQGAVLRIVEGITETDLVGTVAAYDAAIAYLDEQVDRLLRAMEERGTLDDTWVIVSSDHGELFGEHGLQGHGNALYLPVVRIPMLVIPPGGLARTVSVPDWVGLTDLAATILDVSIDEQDRLPGRSLARFWETSGANPTIAGVGPGVPAGSEADDASRSMTVTDVDIGSSVVLTEVNQNTANPTAWEPTAQGSLKSVLSGRYQYIRSTTGVEELYDAVVDPDQLRDLSDTEAGRLPLSLLSRSLDSILASSDGR